jgi:hypothetical protein
MPSKPLLGRPVVVGISDAVIAMRSDEADAGWIASSDPAKAVAATRRRQIMNTSTSDGKIGRKCKSGAKRAGIRNFHDRLCLDGRTHVDLLVREILAQAIVGGARMRLHAFEARNARRYLRDLLTGIPVHALPRERPQKLVNG